MKVGGLLRQKVLVTVRRVLPMCACERQTKAETDRGSQPGEGAKREREILATEQVRAVHSICPAPGFLPGGGWPRSVAEEDLSGHPGAALGSGGL